MNLIFSFLPLGFFFGQLFSGFFGRRFLLCAIEGCLSWHLFFGFFFIYVCTIHKYFVFFLLFFNCRCFRHSCRQKYHALGNDRRPHAPRKAIHQQTHVSGFCLFVLFLFFCLLNFQIIVSATTSIKVHLNNCQLWPLFFFYFSFIATFVEVKDLLQVEKQNFRSFFFNALQVELIRDLIIRLALCLAGRFIYIKKISMILWNLLFR